jgi:hypothetical protein
MIPPSTKPMPGTTKHTPGMGGDPQKPQSSSKMEQRIEGAGVFRRSSVWPSVLQGDRSCNPRGSVLGVESQGSQGKVKGRMEGAFNAKHELGGLREWLRQLRCDVDAGLERVDVVIKKLEGHGPGQMKKKKTWISKPKPKKMFRLKEKRLNSSGKGVGVGPGSVAHPDEAGPSTGRPVVYSKPNPEVAGFSAGRDLIEGLPQKPNTNLQLGGEKDMGLGLSERLDRIKGNLGGLGSKEGTEIPGDGRNSSSGSVDNISAIPDSIPAEVSPVEGSDQRPPMGRPGNSDCAQRPPASGHGAKCGDRGLVSRPESSWVAGRTGFGPVLSGEVVGSSDLVAIPEKKTDIVAKVVCGDEALSGGEEKVAQVCSLDTTAALEVYRRRDAPSQWNSKVRLRDSGDIMERDMAETSMQGGADYQGVGQSSAENPFVENTLEKSMEVSDIAGLSWEGQKGRKEECLRRIVVDKTEIGRGGDTDITDFQQAVNSMGRFWGNCSDDEA